MSIFHTCPFSGQLASLRLIGTNDTRSAAASRLSSKAVYLHESAQKIPAAVVYFTTNILSTMGMPASQYWHA